MSTTEFKFCSESKDNKYKTIYFLKGQEHYKKQDMIDRIGNAGFIIHKDSKT